MSAAGRAAPAARGQPRSRARDRRSADVVLTAPRSRPALRRPSLAAAQQAVLAAQQRVDAALNTATKALDSATTVCAAAGVGTTDAGDADQRARSTACQTATQAVLHRADRGQRGAAAARRRRRPRSTRSWRSRPRRLRPPASGSGAGTGAAADRRRLGRREPVERRELGRPRQRRRRRPISSPYQKAVDAAAAEVAVAEQAIAQATIVEPDRRARSRR